MPDWKAEVESRLGPEVDAASRSGVVEELAQHLEERYRELVSGGAEEAAAHEAVVAELAQIDRLPAALPPARRAPKHDPVPAGAARGKILADFGRDLRYGLRGMRKSPGFTFFAVLTLGAGIGAITTVFTIINTLLVHPLPVDHASRLVALYDSGPNGGARAAARLAISYPNLRDYAAQRTVLRDAAGFTPPMALTLNGKSGPERMFGEFVTRRYFDTLGLRPAAGRFFMEEEDSEPGSAPVAVLSYNAWKGRFGGSGDILGRALELNGVVFTVVGVAPAGFLGVSAVFGPDVWLPATMCERAFPAELANALSDRAKPFFHGIGRLRAGSRRAQAQAALDVVSAALQLTWPDIDKGHRLLARPVTDELYSTTGGTNGLAFGTAVLLAIVILILGIACSNVANLLLARGAARAREVAVRLSVGADRARLVRQMLTESLLLSLASCAAGVLIGYQGCEFVWSFVPAEVRGNMVAPRLDAAVLGAALLVSISTAFLFGLAPALRAARTDVAAALKEGTRAAGRRRHATLPNILLAGQVAFSLLCLVTAALFFRSIQRAYKLDPGFQTDHLALFLTNAAQSGYDEARLKEFYRTVRERVAGLPGVASVSWASGLPFWNSASRAIEIEGMGEREKSQAMATVMITVDDGYFETMGIPLARGRLFTNGDREGSLPAAIINERLARERWPNGDALGHRFQFAGDGTWRQVVGVVKNANYGTLGEAPQPCVYLPLRQNFSQSMTLYVRTKDAPAGLLAPVAGEIREMDPDIEASDVRTGGKLIEQVLWGPRVGVSLLGVFGSLALALASVGLYGVLAYAVNRRRREIGVRMALGASRGAVLRLVLREGMMLVGCGLALGFALFVPLSAVISGMLFGTSPADPASLAAASAVLIVAALAACSVPAFAATRVDPMAAIRGN